MTPDASSPTPPKDAGANATPRRGFCSACGVQLDPNARFCHNCGVPVGGDAAYTPAAYVPVAAVPRTPGILMWGVPTLALIAVVVIVAAQGARDTPAESTALGGPAGMVRAPDISSMTPGEQADRLFNRVMTLVSEGKTDSAKYFAPMAFGAFEALTPLTMHLRYDMGLVALVTEELTIATAQADTILRERPTHLLGLALAARAAEARGDAAAGAAFRRRLVAAETAERATNLPEYTDHANDIRAAIDLTRGQQD